MVRPLPFVLGAMALFTLACTMDGTGETGKSVSDTDPTAYFFWVGAVSAPESTFSIGLFGVGVFGSKEGDYICMDVGELEETTSPEYLCDGCTYAFNFTVKNTTPEGTYCDAVGLTADGDYDDVMIGFGWGADHYYYQGPYYTYTFDDPIYAYYEGEWFMMAYSYGGNGYTYQSPDYMQFMAPFIQGTDTGYAWVYGTYSRE